MNDAFGSTRRAWSSDAIEMTNSCTQTSFPLTATSSRRPRSLDLAIVSSFDGMARRDRSYSPDTPHKRVRPSHRSSPRSPSPTRRTQRPPRSRYDDDRDRDRDRERDRDGDRDRDYRDRDRDRRDRDRDYDRRRDDRRDYDSGSRRRDRSSDRSRRDRDRRD